MLRDRLVDIGGYRLEVQEQQAGSPAVVFLHGLTGCTEEWIEGALPLLADDEFLQVAYSRPAVGHSDPLPAEIALQQVGLVWAIGQMRDLLHASGVPGPWVLAGHSIGALMAMLADRIWPDDVAGLVLVDPTSGLFWEERFPNRDLVVSDADSGGIQFDTAALGREWAASTPSGRRVPCVVVSSSPGRWQRLSDEHMIPLRPLTADEVDVIWQERQREYAAEFDAVHLVSHTAGHTVHIEQPELVAEVVRSVVEAVRTGGRPRLSADQIHALGADLVRT